jgi:hypothetical protein
MQANNVPGMMLPEVPTPKLTGVAVYPDRPEVSDQTERGDLVGKRIESLTYVCEKAGSVVIPGVQMRWWNPTESAWKEHTLPEINLDIAVNPEYGTPTSADAGSAEPVAGISSSWWWLSVIAVAVGVVFLVRFWPRADVKTGRFRKLLRACRSNDAAAAYHAFNQWRAVAVESSVQLPSDVQAQLDRVQQVIVGQQTNWHGDDFAAVLRFWRVRLRHADKKKRAANVLPQLNPVSNA